MYLTRREDGVVDIPFFRPDESTSCPAHPYNAYIISREPLVTYISSFVSKAEIDHLLKAR